MSYRILALDTTEDASSVALLNQKSTHTVLEITPCDHSQRILPLIQELLQAQKIELHSLDALAFSRGPGSFTGTRIGIGIAQGLALGANLPMIAISSLATMAQSCWRQTSYTKVLVAMNARMGEIYWAEYQRNDKGQWRGIETEILASIKTAQDRISTLSGKWAIVGSGWHAYPQLLISDKKVQLIATNILRPVAEDMIPLALNAWQNNETLTVENAEPVYLHNFNSITWKKLPGHKN